MQDCRIRIVCVSCETSRRMGRQHTKRLLPEFLKRFCRIRIDLAFMFLRRHYSPSGKYNLEEACVFLGCIDKRTARRHLAETEGLVKAAGRELQQELSHKSGFIVLQALPPEAGPIRVLDDLVVKLREYHIHLHGKLPALDSIPFSALSAVHRCSNGLKVSIT